MVQIYIVYLTILLRVNRVTPLCFCLICWRLFCINYIAVAVLFYWVLSDLWRDLLCAVMIRNGIRVQLCIL